MWTLGSPPWHPVGLGSLALTITFPGLRYVFSWLERCLVAFQGSPVTELGMIKWLGGVIALGVLGGTTSFSTALHFSFICVKMETCLGLPLLRILGNTVLTGPGLGMAACTGYRIGNEEWGR